LAELHPRNNLNLCLFGGFTELMAIIFGHPHHMVRVAACAVCSTICMNNQEVQDFASKSGAFNLIEQFKAETENKGREAVLAALASFVKGNNFPAKKKFVQEFDGLVFCASLLTDDTATSSVRLYKKLLILINDLVVNDDMIVE